MGSRGMAAADLVRVCNVSWKGRVRRGSSSTRCAAASHRVHRMQGRYVRLETIMKVSHWPDYSSSVPSTQLRAWPPFPTRNPGPIPMPNPPAPAPVCAVRSGFKGVHSPICRTARGRPARLPCPPVGLGARRGRRRGRPVGRRGAGAGAAKRNQRAQVRCAGHRRLYGSISVRVHVRARCPISCSGLRAC